MKEKIGKLRLIKAGEKIYSINNQTDFIYSNQEIEEREKQGKYTFENGFKCGFLAGILLALIIVKLLKIFFENIMIFRKNFFSLQKQKIISYENS